jgi:hypothetical protein
MDKSGGQSVAYLIDPNLMSNKIADLSIDSITNLFKRVAAGLVFDTSKLDILNLLLIHFCVTVM